MVNEPVVRAVYEKVRSGPRLNQELIRSLDYYVKRLQRESALAVAGLVQIGHIESQESIIPSGGRWITVTISVEPATDTSQTIPSPLPTGYEGAALILGLSKYAQQNDGTGTIPVLSEN